jgi:hypothetical protein
VLQGDKDTSMVRQLMKRHPPTNTSMLDELFLNDTSGEGSIVRRLVTPALPEVNCIARSFLSQTPTGQLSLLEYAFRTKVLDVPVAKILMSESGGGAPSLLRMFLSRGANNRECLLSVMTRGTSDSVSIFDLLVMGEDTSKEMSLARIALAQRVQVDNGNLVMERLPIDTDFAHGVTLAMAGLMGEKDDHFCGLRALLVGENTVGNSILRMLLTGEDRGETSPLRVVLVGFFKCFVAMDLQHKTGWQWKEALTMLSGFKKSFEKHKHEAASLDTLKRMVDDVAADSYVSFMWTATRLLSEQGAEFAAEWVHVMNRVSEELAMAGAQAAEDSLLRSLVGPCVELCHSVGKMDWVRAAMRIPAILSVVENKKPSWMSRLVGSLLRGG